MTVEISCQSQMPEISAECRNASTEVSLLSVHPAPKVTASIGRTARLAAALVAMTLISGIISHPVSTVEVQVMTPYIIGLSELDNMYNYTDLLGRYIVTTDGRIFEVKEA